MGVKVLDCLFSCDDLERRVSDSCEDPAIVKLGFGAQYRVRGDVAMASRQPSSVGAEAAQWA